MEELDDVGADGCEVSLCGHVGFGERVEVSVDVEVVWNAVTESKSGMTAVDESVASRYISWRLAHMAWRVFPKHLY